MAQRARSVYRRSQPLKQGLFSGNSSPNKSDNQIRVKNTDLLSKRPNRRYMKSSRMGLFQEKVGQIEKAYNIPQSFFSQNLRIKDKIRDRNYHAIKEGYSQDRLHKVANPVTPYRESYKMIKEMETTKDRSFFNTNSLDQHLQSQEQEGIEELFYKQVRFIQRCKRIAQSVR